MDFNSLLDEFESMVGMVLKSIKGKADITLLGVNRDENSFLLRDSKGRVRSRPFAEARRIWEALTQHPAIHVDSILGGSGSSRNQPETMFANLPFVEVLVIDRKKYIALVSAPSHNPGTLRQMDLVQAENIRSKFSEYGTGLPWNVIVVVDNLDLTVNAIEGTCGISQTPVPGQPYAREFHLSGNKLLVVGQEPNKPEQLPLGTYPVVAGPPGANEVEKIQICGARLWVKDILGAKVLVVD